MKKLFYVICLLVITALSSFSTTGYHSSFSKISEKKFGSCPTANGLLAQKNFGTVKLTWSGSGASYNYGGYYNYRTSDGGYGSANFSGSTAGNYANITVPSTTYSLTYQVSTVCTDGSITGSAGPASFNF